MTHGIRTTLQQDSPRTEAEAITARILETVADHLDAIPARIHPIFEVEDPDGRCMTEGWRGLAIERALPSVLQHVVSKWIRTHARSAALAAMPPITGTTAEYAARLREIATRQNSTVAA